MTKSKYLDCFKVYESAVKSAGYESALVYEQTFSEGDSHGGKLKFCRQCRNFLAHEPEDFFDVSDKMGAFLTEEAAKLDKAYLPVKKFQKKNFIEDNQPVSYAASAIYPTKEERNLPVFKPRGKGGIFETPVGSIGWKDIVCYAVKNNLTSKTKVSDVMSKKVKKDEFVLIPDTTLKKDLPEGKVCIVTNSKGEITGWI